MPRILPFFLILLCAFSFAGEIQVKLKNNSQRKGEILSVYDDSLSFKVAGKLKPVTLPFTKIGSVTINGVEVKEITRENMEYVAQGLDPAAAKAEKARQDSIEQAKAAQEEAARQELAAEQAALADSIAKAEAAKNAKPAGYVANEELKMGIPVNIGIVPLLSLSGSKSKYAKHFLSYSLLWGRSGQVSGLALGAAHITHNRTIGIQTGAFYNKSWGPLYGMQYSAVYNKLESGGIGLQFSPIANHSNGSFGGVQLAPVVNISDTIYGLQIGLINIANRCYGVPIGLVNVIGKRRTAGYLYYNDFGLIAYNLQLGSPRIHTVLNLSMGRTLIAGIGYASYLNLYKGLFVQPEVDLDYISAEDNKRFENINGGSYYETALLTILPSVGWQFFSHLALKASVSYRIPFFDDEISSWVGYNIGLQF